MGYRFTILGCGSSGGVPRIGNDWGACDPTNPKNMRRRSSLLIERLGSDGVTQVLVDTSPDLREQLLDAGISRLDGVVYTHDHADHTHGIDDLRVVFFNRRARIPVYFDRPTSENLLDKFGYCFQQPTDSNYVALLDGHVITPYQPFKIQGDGGEIEITAYIQEHGNAFSLGLRVGRFAYSTDVNAFPQESLPYLDGLDVLVLDTLRYNPHPCHLSVDEALKIIETHQPKRSVLTHLHQDLDYQTLNNQLPAHIEPAFDGMVIEMNDAEL